MDEYVQPANRDVMGSLVSAIIPTYNSAHLLTRALESTIGQTYQNVEIIVVDDGSTDNTEDIVRNYGKRVKYRRLPHAGLPAVPRNAGLQLAQGEYIAFLDADDAWQPEKLEKQVEVICSDKNIGLVCTNTLRESKSRSRPYFPAGTIARRNSFSFLLRENFIITSSVLTRHEILSQQKGFCEDILFKAIEDYDLWLRIALNHDIYFIDELLTIYHDAPSESLRSSQNMTQYWKGMMQIYSQFNHIKLDRETFRLIRSQKVSALRGLTTQLLKEKQYRSLLSTILKFFFQNSPV
ncbi:MAG: glycosyltransferase family 2 protein [Dehalococcoidales bacterium]|jgi:glycosyltransferase involved in cell wall biosynthesis